MIPHPFEPWPATAREWEFYAVCSQLKADQRRQQEHAERQEFRRWVTSTLKAGGTVIGCLLAMAVFWLVAWGLAVLCQ